MATLTQKQRRDNRKPQGKRRKTAGKHRQGATGKTKKLIFTATPFGIMLMIIAINLEAASSE